MVGDRLPNRDWFRQRLAELGLEGRVDVAGYAACNGGPLPEPERFEAAVLGGSLHSVSEDRPWQRRIMAWLETWQAGGRPPSPS